MATSSAWHVTLLLRNLLWLPSAWSLKTKALAFKSSHSQIAPCQLWVRLWTLHYVASFCSSSLNTPLGSPSSTRPTVPS